MQKQKIKCPKCGCKIPLAEAFELELAHVRAQAAKYGLLMKALRKERTELRKRDIVLQGRIIDLDIARREVAERKPALEQASTTTTNHKRRA